MTVVLQLREIHKRFGTTVALDGAGLALHKGELHALLGENGAGKSTLMRIAYGLAHADSGEMAVDGRIASVRSAREARRLGIGMVHQHPTSIPSLTVAENVALAAGWRIRPPELRERVIDLCRKTGLPLEPDVYAGRLPIALRQRLEIVKALAANARILLLDEPTAVLAPSESEELLAMLRRYVGAGNSAVLITHKLGEALSAADNVTVLRHGSVTLIDAAPNTTPESLARAMIGSDIALAAGRPRRSVVASTGTVHVRAEALDVARGGRYGIALRAAALTLRGGEVVGVAAVEGNGQRELLRAIAGLIEPLRGTLTVSGPVAFVPEDRTTEGLIPTLSLSENFVLGLGAAAPGVRGHRIAWREAEAATAEAIAKFRIRAPGPGARAGTLSGGNQQKLVIARALAGGPRVIVAENPARGLDVAAAAEVFQRLRGAAAAGAAVIFHSSDLDEVLAESDRIVVVSGGAVREVPLPSRDTIGRMMVGLE